MTAAPGGDTPTPQGFGTQGHFGVALSRVRKRLPSRVRDSHLIDSLLLGPAVLPPSSWLRFLQLAKRPGRWPAGAGTVPLVVRPFQGQPIHVRPGGSDWEAVHSALFGGYHRPPSDLKSVRTILDLGANIGITVADLAVCYPDARIIGIELDGENADLARQNTSRWADRVTIVHGAAWTQDGTIPYGDGSRGEWGYQVAPAMASTSAGHLLGEAPAYSISTLIDRLAPQDTVDYVKMDVEGAEIQLLAAGEEWAERVRCIKVEIHHPFNVPACVRELTRLGFNAVPDPSGILGAVGYR